MSSAKKEAQDALLYYLRLLAVNQDLKWNGDNDEEVRGIVDLIIKAAKE